MLESVLRKVQIFNPVKFAKCFRTFLRRLLLVIGAPYLVKLQVTFLIKKKNELHSPGIFVAI